jgi:hypothetical protein
VWKSGAALLSFEVRQSIISRCDTHGTTHVRAQSRDVERQRGAVTGRTRSRRTRATASREQIGATSVHDMRFT